MFCPKCGAEYREGFDECSDCQIPLLEFLLPDVEGDPNAQMVEIFCSANPLQISMAKTLLEDADLEHSTLGEGLRFLLGAGGGGMAGNPTTGPARIVVRSEDHEKALQILEEMPEETELEVEEDST